MPPPSRTAEGHPAGPLPGVRAAHHPRAERALRPGMGPGLLPGALGGFLGGAGGRSSANSWICF